MNHKIVTVCLMTSQRIVQVLSELAAAPQLVSERQMTVLAALKLMLPNYRDAGTADIASDLRAKSDKELEVLARRLHPVLCSLKLEKWLGVSGQCHYLAQSAVPSGGEAQRVLLDCAAREIVAGGLSQASSPGSAPFADVLADESCYRPELRH